MELSGCTVSIRKCYFAISNNVIDNNLCHIHMEYMTICLAKVFYFAQFRGIRIFLQPAAILFLALHGSKYLEKGRDNALLTYTNIQILPFIYSCFVLLCRKKVEQKKA